MADLLIDISKRTGEDLRQKLIELTNATEDEWIAENTRIFSINGNDLFKLTPDGTPNQPRSGMITFKTGSEWLRPRYEINYPLKSILFATKYNRFLRNTFEATEPDPNDKVFQHFVLFQFEIARRVERDRSDLPRRQDVEDAINRAVQLDTDEAYRTLIKMFKEGRWQWCYLVRQRHYRSLKKLTEQESK